MTFPTTAQSSNAIGFGNSVSAFSTGVGDFIAGAPGYTGTLPTTTATPPIPLVGAAAIPLQSLQVAALPLLTGGSSGGGGGGGGGGRRRRTRRGHPSRAVHADHVQPPFGSSFVPSVTTLSTFNYAPIPLNVALQQYDVPDGFKQRFYAYYHPGSSIVNRGQNRSRNNNGGSGRWTLGRKVFTRGRFHQDSSYQWTHTVNEGTHTTRRVVPVQLHIQRYTSPTKLSPPNPHTDVRRPRLRRNQPTERASSPHIRERRPVAIPEARTARRYSTALTLPRAESTIFDSRLASRSSAGLRSYGSRWTFSRLKLRVLASAVFSPFSSSPTVRISRPRPAPEDLGHPVIGPVVDVVERALEEEPLGRVAVVVEDHDDRIQAVAGDRRELHPGHLERAVADDHEDPRRGVGHARADAPPARRSPSTCNRPG